MTIPVRHPGRNASQPDGAPHGLSPGNRRRRALLLAAVWTALVLLFWFGLFVSSMRPGLLRAEASDLYGYFFPKFVYASEEMARGELPLWNPYEYGGLPFLGAAQTAVLYPPRMVAFALLPPAAALHAFMVGHYLLLGAGAFVMLRAFGVGVAGAVFGALCMTFQPSMMGSHYSPIRIAGFTWVPWMVAALVYAVERRSLAAALGLALAAALQGLSGYPEYAVDTALALALLCPAAAGRAAHAATGRPARLRAALHGLALVAGAAVAAALVTAPQTMAVAEMFGASARAVHGVPFMAGQRFELATWGTGIAAWVSSISTFGYLPALGWILVFVGLVSPRRPYRWGLLALWIVASVAYSEPLRAVPPFSLFRSFLCWSTILYVPLAAFAGAGFDRAAAAVGGTRPTRREIAVAVLALLVTLPLLAPRSLVWLAITAALLAGGAVSRGRSPRLAIGAALVATLATIWTWVPPPLPQTLWHRYGRGEVPYPSAWSLRARGADLRNACGGEGDWRLIGPAEALLGVPVLGRVRAVQGYPESIAPARMTELLAAAGLVPETILPLDWERLAAAGGVLRLLNVGCVVVEPGHERALARLGFVPGGALADGRTAFVRPTDGLAFLPPAVRREDGAAAALAAVLDPAFDPAAQVVLETPSYAPAGGTPTRRAGRVERIDAAPGRLAFRVDAPVEAHLVVSVGHAPGWRARVDGHATPILRADYAFMAVRLDAGDHVVELRYRPQGFTAAVALSFAGLALLAAGGVQVLAAARRTPRQSFAGAPAASSEA